MSYFQGRRYKYTCLRTVWSGKYLDVRRMKCAHSLGYYITRNCVTYRSPSIVRIGKCWEIVCAEHEARMRERGTTCKMLIGKLTGVLRSSWEECSKMYPRNWGWWSWVSTALSGDFCGTYRCWTSRFFVQRVSYGNLLDLSVLSVYDHRRRSSIQSTKYIWMELHCQILYHNMGWRRVMCWGC